MSSAQRNAVPILYVPLLMITHVIAFYLLMRLQRTVVRARGDPGVEKETRPEESNWLVRYQRTCEAWLVLRKRLWK